jgi:hypothetical protein
VSLCYSIGAGPGCGGDLMRGLYTASSVPSRTSRLPAIRPCSTELGEDVPTPSIEVMYGADMRYDPES